MFDYQQAFDIAITLVGGLGGWVLANVQRQLDAARQTQDDLSNKVQKIEVLVAGEYVRRDELRKDMDNLFTLLRRIEEKLDTKVDK